MNDTATQVEMCGATIRVGDRVKVRYTTGKRMKDCWIEGQVTKLWANDDGTGRQGQVNNGWCFHEGDELLQHVPAGK